MRRNVLLKLHCTKELRESFPDEWRAWRAMWARTTYESSKDFPNYGGRGIRVEDDRWRDFETFLLDVGEKPEPKRSYSLSRIKKNLGYYPENCKWATARETVKNSRHPGRDATHCKRGHPLESENLVPSSLEHGMRKCRKCARLNALARDAEKKKFRKVIEGKEYVQVESNIEKHGVSSTDFCSGRDAYQHRTE